MKSKFLKIIWPILYLILVLFVCGSGCMIFHSYYYKSIFVDGESMYPTLNGGTRISQYQSNFGIINPHEKAINEIERFNIITTYYPWDEKDYSQETTIVSDDNFIEKAKLDYEPGTGRTPLETAYYKIKRVVGMPGDIFKISNGEFYLLETNSIFYKNIYGKTTEEIEKYRVEYGINYDIDLAASFKKVDLPYERHFGQNINIKDTSIIQLAKDDEEKCKNEYFVIGDNWGNSTDCATKKLPIYRENIVGVLVAIEGTCKIVDGKSNSGNNNKTCEERKYFKPIFF